MSIVLNDYMAWAGGSDIGQHLPYLHQRAKTAKVALELGVRSGCSTAALLCGVEEADGLLWSVDIDMPQGPACDWHDNPRWYFVQGDDMILAQTEGILPDEVDLLFIDSSHRYAHTLSELTVYGLRVKVGGVILLHDTELESAPGSSDENDRGFPVRRAVNDWCRHRFLTPEWREGCNGLAVIEVT
jgi:predicted O-methyltransferase YrrM